MAKKTSRRQKTEFPPEKVRQDTLPNGLRIVTDEVPHVQSVTIGIQIEAGSRDDPDDKPGLAHFIEHAVFKGTERRTWLDIAKNIEENGGYLDAYTTREHTCIYLRCLEPYLATSFDLLADLVSSPLFPPEEMEKEKEVVIEEISSVNDTPEELIFDDFDLRSFPGHPLGRPILGSEKSIAGFSSNDLKGFMDDHYYPENMLVTATGSARHETVTELAANFLGNLKPRPKRGYQRQPFQSCDYKPFRKLLKKPVHQSQIVLGTAIERHDPLFYSLMVLNTILGNGMSSLLNLELREKRGLVYNVYSSLSFYDDMTALNIYAGTDGNKSDATLELMEKLLGSDALFSPDSVEVESAKRRLIGSLVMGTEKMTRRMSQTASDISYFGRYIPNREKQEAIESVTAGDITRAAGTLLREAPFSTLVYKPKR